MSGFRRPTAMTNLRLLVASLVFAVLGVVLLSCGDSGGADPGPADGSTTLDVTYVVTGVIERGEPRALVPGSEIRLRFDGDRLGITAGCNSMGGTYTLDGTRLTVADLATTEMGCAAPLMEQDTWVAALFAEPVQLTTGAEPTLISGDVVLTLADREQVSPDEPLVGTSWTLDSIGTGGADGAVSSVPEGVTASVNFEDDGSVRLFDGCNGGGGPVTVDGATITWGQIGFTLVGCSDPGVVEVSQAVHEVLTGSTTFTIEEKSLTITNGDRFLGFRSE